MRSNLQLAPKRWLTGTNHNVGWHGNREDAVSSLWVLDRYDCLVKSEGVSQHQMHELAINGGEKPYQHYKILLNA